VRFPGLGDPSRLSQRSDSKNAREQIREREEIYHVHRKTTTYQVNHIGKPRPAAGTLRLPGAMASQAECPEPPGRLRR
jgi:hypothetical protein